MNALPFTRTAGVRFLTLALLFALSAGVARAQQAASGPAIAEAAPLDLEQLLLEVRTANPALEAARLETEALSTRPAQVSALPDPTAMVTYQPYPILTARGWQRTQWRVEQMIPYPGKLGLQGDVAAWSARVSAHEAEVFEQDLLVQAKQAYYELYRVQQQERLIDAFQEQLVGFEDAASTQYAVGTGMQQAILKAQVERNDLERVQLTLEEQRTSAVETLSRLTDRPVSEVALMTADLTPPELPAFDEEALLRLALQERPEADALEAAGARADAQVALARKQFLPDFGVSLTYFDIAGTDMTAMSTGKDAVAVGASVKIPLQRGRLKAQLEEARLRRAQVAARQRSLETSFRTQIADLTSQLRQAHRQLAMYRDVLVPQAATTLEASMSAYTTGRTGFLDLLDAERMLFSMQRSYEDTLARYLKTTAALERALGVASLREAADVPLLEEAPAPEFKKIDLPDTRDTE